MSTLESVKSDVERMFSLKQEIDLEESRISEKKKELEGLKLKVLGSLEDAGIDNFKVPGVGMISAKNNFSVTVPKDPEKKEAFMQYLKANNLESLLTVHSQTLNAFYKEELEKAVEKGNSDFSIPGIDEPKVYKTISMRKG